MESVTHVTHNGDSLGIANRRNSKSEVDLRMETSLSSSGSAPHHSPTPQTKNVSHQ